MESPYIGKLDSTFIEGLNHDSERTASTNSSNHPFSEENQVDYNFINREVSPLKRPRRTTTSNLPRYYPLEDESDAVTSQRRRRRATSNSNIPVDSSPSTPIKTELYRSPPSITPIRIPKSKSGHRALTFINFTEEHAEIISEAVAPSGVYKRKNKVKK